MSTLSPLGPLCEERDRLLHKGIDFHITVVHCQSLNWRFFANLYEAFLLQVLPQAQPCYGSPVHTLREYFKEVWIVDGSRLDAVAKRLKLLWDVRAQVLPGCLTAFYDLYRGMVRHLAFNADAAAGELPRAIAALEHVPEGTLLVGDRLYGVAPSLRP